MSELLRIEAFLPAAEAERAAAFLALHCAHGWEEAPAEGGVLFRLYLDDLPAAEELLLALHAAFPLAVVSRQGVERQDWALAWREFFTPVLAGDRFAVLPPWLAHEVPAGRIPILIEPKTAFGTGHHATTALCLAALDRLEGRGLLHRNMHFLDLGTGSGILGLACCLLGMVGMGVDVDPLAVANARENKRLNLVGDAFAVGVGSVAGLARTRFGLILANILAGPLKAMAPQVVRRLDRHGSLVLSGILAEQAEAVAAAYIAQGLPEPEVMARDEWVALVWPPRV
ncbi:MAG: 50S ribosomal protein L11 methyltransferase [Thermodesulfobacteriota bacterium]